MEREWNALPWSGCSVITDNFLAAIPSNTPTFLLSKVKSLKMGFDVCGKGFLPELARVAYRTRSPRDWWVLSVV